MAASVPRSIGMELAGLASQWVAGKDASSSIALQSACDGDFGDAAGRLLHCQGVVLGLLMRHDTCSISIVCAS